VLSFSMAPLSEIERRASKAEQLLGVPRAYHRSQLIRRGGKLWMPIRVHSEIHHIPIVNVGKPDDPLGIAYLNTNPEINPRMARAVAEQSSLLIASRAPRIVAMMGSHKSEWLTRQSVGLASRFLRVDRPIILVHFPTSLDVTTVRDEIGPDGKIFSYRPVTLEGKPPDVLKYMGLRKSDYELIHSVCPNGEGFLIFDDVGTTMSTVRAAEESIGFGISSVHRVALSAREAPEDGLYPPQLGPNTSTTMFLPEMRFPLSDASLLFSPTDIPAAR
jgi:hypothetical protein